MVSRAFFISAHWGVKTTVEPLIAAGFRPWGYASPKFERYPLTLLVFDDGRLFR